MKIEQNELVKGIHPQIEHALESLVLKWNLPYYYEFLAFVSFFRFDAVRTAGVNSTLKLNFYWCKKFFDELSEQEVNFLIIHELFHLLFDHCKRGKNLNQKLVNIAADMIINTIIMTDMPKGFASMPKGKHEGLRLPKDYDGILAMEFLYEWLSNKQNEYKNFKKLGGTNPCDDYLSKIFDNLENDEDMLTDTHLEDDCPDDVKKQIIDEIRSNLRNRGLESGNIQTTLGKLIKSKKNYMKEIKSSIAMIKGSQKEKTYKLPNRKGLLGIKGKTKISKELVCILDTSGSMHGHIEQIMGCLLHDKQIIHLIQIDVKVNDSKTINDMKKLKRNFSIFGGGGTTIQPAIEYVKNNKKINKLPVVLLTDGGTETLDFSGIKKALIISCGNITPFKKQPNIKHILIEE